MQIPAVEHTPAPATPTTPAAAVPRKLTAANVSAASLKAAQSDGDAAAQAARRNAINLKA